MKILKSNRAKSKKDNDNNKNKFQTRKVQGGINIQQLTSTSINLTNASLNGNKNN